MQDFLLDFRLINSGEPGTKTIMAQLFTVRQFVILVVIMIIPGWSAADIVETTIQIPVQISLGDREVIRQKLVVTVTRDSAQTRAAVVLIAHGRPASPEDRARMGQVKYPGNAVWLAQHGFVVVVPTRIGYGITGGPDLDYSGECTNKDYLGALNGAVAQYRQVLAYMAGQPYVDPGHGVFIGESFGGLVALAFASGDRSAGIDGIVNMAGGDGGDYSHLEQPCQPERLEKSFAALGKNGHLPALWMYSLNDRFWGTLFPRQWFRAYTASGGKAEFVQLPADKNNGHFIFNRNVLAWHTDMERFLVQLGLARASNEAVTHH